MDNKDDNQLKLYSKIFDESYEARKNPFQFTKPDSFSSLADLGPLATSSYLMRPSKKCPFHSTLLTQARISHEAQQFDLGRSERSPVVSPLLQPRTPVTEKTAVFKERYFCLVGDKLVQFRSESEQTSPKILSVKNARLKKTHLKDDQSKLFGFILIAKGTAFWFYDQQEQVIQDWVDALKQVCILTDIKAYLKFGELLGKGAFAQVHRCTRIEGDDKRTYALKSIKCKKIRETKRNLRNLLNEIDIMRQLKHSSVCELIEVYESSQYVHLVLTLMEGGELMARIRSLSVYNENTAIKVMKTFLEGLAYCHDEGVVHRDLKPENLLLTSKNNDWELKIADFGLSSFYKGRGLTIKCGTPGFIAPEILKEQSYDPKVDVFSAGVILYSLLSGSHPFKSRRQKELLLENENPNIEFPDSRWSRISDKAKDLTKKMLEVEPENRLTAREALNHPWLRQDQEEVNRESLVLTKAEEEIKETEEEGKSDEQGPRQSTQPQQTTDDGAQSPGGMLVRNPLPMPRIEPEATEKPPNSPFFTHGRSTTPEKTPVVRNLRMPHNQHEVVVLGGGYGVIRRPIRSPTVDQNGKPPFSFKPFLPNKPEEQPEKKEGKPTFDSPTKQPAKEQVKKQLVNLLQVDIAQEEPQIQQSPDQEVDFEAVRERVRKVLLNVERQTFLISLNKDTFIDASRDKTETVPEDETNKSEFDDTTDEEWEIATEFGTLSANIYQFEHKSKGCVEETSQREVKPPRLTGGQHQSNRQKMPRVSNMQLDHSALYLNTSQRFDLSMDSRLQMNQGFSAKNSNN